MSPGGALQGVKIGTLTGPRPVIKPWRGLTARRAM